MPDGSVGIVVAMLEDEQLLALLGRPRDVAGDAAAHPVDRHADTVAPTERPAAQTATSATGRMAACGS